MLLQIMDVNVLYSPLASSHLAFGSDYLGKGKPNIAITLATSDITYEREKARQEDMLEGLPVRQLTDEQLELTALQRKIVEEFFAYDTLLFHGSVVAVDGQAYLFTAKSGTGKSTHTRLWREVFGNRAVMVNDDKPFLQITPEGATAWGSPWMGKHGLGSNIGVPLKAICILERGEENKIAPISPKEALPMLLQQSQRPQKAQNFPKYMDLIDGLAGKVAFYRMACNMDPQAARVAYCAMSGEEKEETL